jgi:regulator of cell morphogenesis and NO signaling
LAEINADMTINEIITMYPETVSIFNRHGIDSCCGGALPLAEVARKHRLDFIALLAELEQA